MPSLHSFEPGELPAQYQPHGYVWLRSHLLARGYTNPRVYDAPTGQTCVSVNQLAVSKKQLAFDAEPTSGRLVANADQINVEPGKSVLVTITGPAGQLVKVRFDGIGFVSETEFTIPKNNTYEYAFGPCPDGLRVVSPQLFDFYVEDNSCSPVAVKVTFK